MASRISPKDVANALKTLNNEQSKELFFQLDVPLHILDGIEGSHRGNMCKIHYIQAWFDQEVEASWEKIVAGLKLIGMKALAETLATQQCLGGTPTSAAVNLTPNLPSSPATAPEASSQPMALSRISPTKVVSALDELTTEKAKELFFHLKVRLKTLNDIDMNHTGYMRKIHYIQAWFDQEVEASWEKIVAGLKLIGKKALAETLATQYCDRTLKPEFKDESKNSEENEVGPMKRKSHHQKQVSVVN